MICLRERERRGRNEKKRERERERERERAISNNGDSLIDYFQFVFGFFILTK